MASNRLPAILIAREPDRNFPEYCLPPSIATRFVASPSPVIIFHKFSEGVMVPAEKTDRRIK